MKKPVVAASMASITPVIEKIVESGGNVRLTVTGRSMYPMLRHGCDSVILTGLLERRLKKYDIVLYKRSSGQYVLHRIVRVKQEELILNGDSQSYVENGVFKHQAIARVTGFYRGERYISCNNFFYNLFVRIWVAGLPVRGWMLSAYRWLAGAFSGLRRR